MNVLVSGGSRGLGLAICRHLLGGGHRVATFARSRTPEMDELLAAQPDAFRFAEVDALDDAAVRTSLRETEEAWGPVEALVNNAAVGQDSLLAHTSPEDVARIVAVNLTAPLTLTRHCVRSMLRHGIAGRVLFIGSIGAGQGYPGLSVYAATKAGLEGATRSLARELAGRVTVNTLAPGFFQSEMSDVLLPEQQAAIVRRTPTGELVDAEQILPLVDLMIAPGTNLNGTVLRIDGGAGA